MSGTRIHNGPEKPGPESGSPAKTGKARVENEKPAGFKPVKSKEGKTFFSPGVKPGSQAARPAMPARVPLNSNSPKPDLPAKNVPESGQALVSARELFNRTAAAMGFPKDALSAAILAFARFFSLSISKPLMGNFRREALASGKSSSAKGKAGPEAEALALLAALDKGVVLSPEALERYARVSNGTVSGDSAHREEVPAPEELAAIAAEAAKKDELLDFLNSVPGKNGQYWTVFPFRIIIKGTELRVLIRILKKDPVFRDGERVIADISGPKRQWRCFLKKEAGTFRADIRVYPELPQKALRLLTKEAKRFLGGPAVNFSGFDGILVQNGAGFSSLVDELCDESLLLIDKEV